MYQKRHADNSHLTIAQIDSTWTLRHSGKFHNAHPTSDTHVPSRSVFAPTNPHSSDWHCEHETPKHTVSVYDAKNQPDETAPTSQCPSYNADSYQNHDRPLGNVRTTSAEKTNSAHKHVPIIPNTSIYAHNPTHNGIHAPWHPNTEDCQISNQVLENNCPLVEQVV